MTQPGTADLLLVEDSDADRQFAIRALQKRDFHGRVATAEDGVIALELLHGEQRLRPRVVFLDLQMPRMGGLEVLRRLRADERTCTLPVVTLTSSAEERDISECYRLGVNSYVVKPGDFDQFAETVGTLASYWLQLNQVPR
jgi:CheY-like chemotaxis protein